MTGDLRWALRWLFKNPLFMAAVTAILALGIGANTAVFSIVDAVLLRPLPYESERLVRIDKTTAKRTSSSGITAQDYFRWRDAGLFETMAPYLKDAVTLIGGSEPDQVLSLRTGGRLFDMLGAHALLGRALNASDDDPGSPKVAVLSDRLWRRVFHADQNVIGRAVTIGDEAITVAGVMPRDFEFAYSNVEMWLPLRLTPATPNWLQLIARAKQGVSVPQLQSAMEIVARQMESEDRANLPGLKIDVLAWRETTDLKYERTLVFILAAVGLVLLIACADVAGLLLSRAVQRQKEIAIRAALGAGFWRVLRQLGTESLVLAASGSVAGIAVAYFALQFLAKQLAALPIALPHLQRVALNARVLAFNLVLCVLLAALCSLAPILSASKTDLQAALRTGLGGASRRSIRLFSVLIACEGVFAFLLLVGSGLMIRSLIRLQQEDHGFRPDHVLTMRVPVGTLTQPRPGGKYETKPRQMAYYKDILDRVERIPGVSYAAVVNNLPLSGVNSTTLLNGPDGATIGVSTRTISARYFAAMGIPLLLGRDFSDADQMNSPGVAIVNEYLARQLFPNANPIGRNLPVPDSVGQVTIVGVAKDSSQLDYDQPAKGEVYRPYRQFIYATFMSTIVVRTPGEPLALANALRKEVWAVDSSQPIVKVQTMNEVIAGSIWRPRFTAWIFSVLGGLALLLTSTGVYSVVAYTTTLRAREVAIRMALGATPFKVVGVIMRDAMTPLAAGLAISFVAALLLSRLLASLLYGVSTTDPIAYVSAGALLLATGAAATIRAAWRAATVDPVQSLRAE